MHLIIAKRGSKSARPRNKWTLHNGGLNAVAIARRRKVNATTEGLILAYILLPNTTIF